MARKGAGPILALLLAAAMLAWTWGTWPDVLVGFGGEIALAWRLAEGDVLYRDVEHRAGPLAPYANALLFRAFGASLGSLTAANLAVLAGIAFLLHRLLERIAGALAAAVALVAFLTLFAFAQLEPASSWNYVCPASHAATHGILIALLALAALERRLATRRAVWTASAGFLLGLAFLTSAEIFLALGAGLLLGVLGDRRDVGRDLLLLAACAAMPVASAHLLLASAMPAELAWKGILGVWPDLRAILRDRPRANAERVLDAAGRWIVWAGPAALLSLAWRRGGRGGGWALALGIAAGLATAIFFAVREPPAAWIELGRPLALVSALALAGWLISLRSPRDEDARRRAVLASAVALFALALLARMPLRVRIDGPGFALAMPAATIAVAALVGWVPAVLHRLGGSGALFRGVALGVLAVAVQAHLAMHHAFLARKTTAVGEGADRFLADERGVIVEAAVDALRSRLAPGARLAVLPEGAMINWLLRAPMIRYDACTPAEVLRLGEGTIAAELRRSPPELVALVHLPGPAPGPRFLGQDYGEELMSIVRDGYTAGPLIGGEPLRPGTVFGIRLYALRR